mgnify:CR=1 FL=1
MEQFYVVSLEIKGIKYYFHHERFGSVDAKTGETVEEARGFFCNNLKRAIKWKDRWLAEMFASSFDGTQVEIIYS